MGNGGVLDEKRRALPALNARSLERDRRIANSDGGLTVALTAPHRQMVIRAADEREILGIEQRLHRYDDLLQLA